MNGWTALVPVKAPGARKSRLASLDQAERERLTAAMLDHVLGVLAECPGVAEVAVLSPERPAGWHGLWFADLGRGVVDLADERAVF